MIVAVAKMVGTMIEKCERTIGGTVYGVLVRDDVDVARQVGHVERRLRIVCDRRGRVLLGLAARRVGGL